MPEFTAEYAQTVEKYDLKGQPLNLDITLVSGQAFRWQKTPNGVWSGVVRNKLMELATGDGVLYWRTYPDDDLPLVHDYLRLEDDVNAIYNAISSDDPHMGELIEQFYGMRMLRQDPSETLLSFICSAANSIPRIMTAIATLSAKYGERVCEKEDLCYFAFPSVTKLAEVEKNDLEHISALAFRGANLKSVAEQILEKGEGWLASLRGVSYCSAREQLLTIKGVGSKIADCVCLFSLDKDEAVPVDTHVKQLAQRLFIPDMKAKSITDGVYKRICEAFLERYGKYSGWAQQFLYYEDLLRTRAMGRGLR